MEEEQKKEPHKELQETTSGLISEALASCKDTSLPWYQRATSYIVGLLMIALYVVGDKYGTELIDKIMEIVKAFLG